jgi:serine/threonine-protein kinase
VTAKDDDKTRAELQRRMAMLFKLMWWSFVGLTVFVASQYTIYGERMKVTRPMRVYILSVVGLTAMAAIWRWLDSTRRLSITRLHRIDLIYSIGVGIAFGASAYGQRELHAAGYMALVWSTFTVFARALVVPSSATRTAILSTLAFVPMTVAALVVRQHQDLPGPGFFFGYLLLSFVPIVLATAGSYIIYDLRRQVSATEHLGQYTLDRKIGTGGMGSVYVAHHALLRRPAAVKLLPRDRNSPEELARFEREVQSMSKLAHPNTVAVFDYGHSAEGGLYYAMEYLAPGIDLAQLVRSGGAQPADRVAAILVQICGALGEAHDQGLVHRDVKPGNIILCERGGVPDIAKVVDFGIAKVIGEDVGEIFGTPGYVAPEALVGKPVGPAADLYAVGAVGYFLLAGRRAFEGTTADVCRAQLQATPEPIACAPELAAIVMCCLAIDPAARYSTAGELAAALRALPRAGDWDEARARTWWRDHRRGEASVTPSASTDSITIDLGERVGVRNA